LERFVGAEDQTFDKPADMLKAFCTAKDLSEPLHPLGNGLGDTHDRKHGLFSLSHLSHLPSFISSYLLTNNLPSREGLQVIENWNSANDFILYGKGGEFASNKREDQELLMLSLHLIQVSLVYVNTLMIQQVLATPDWQGRLTAVDLRALSPLKWQHVNPYGTFTLDMQERLALEQVACLP
jgi:hypothetical protein